MPLETVGQIFQSTREEKKISINEIALQTNMGKRYLEALETDNYEPFPSETHILGFIRNYSTYLELDPELLIDVYKRTILQETPAPYEELTAPNRSSFNPTILITILCIIGIVGLIALLLKSGKKHPNTVLPVTPTRTSVNTNKSGTYSGVSITRFFKIGDIYTFPVEGAEKSMIVEKASNSALTISLMNTRYIIPQGKEKMWDFDGDHRSELYIKVAGISNDGAYLTLSRVPRSMPEVRTNDNTHSSSSAATIKGNTIFKSQNRVEINLTISAKGFATVNWIKDRQIRSSKALKKGKTISILAKDSIQITASNPFNLTLNLNNKILGFETSRAVIGLLFKWQKNPEDGLFHLKYERIQ